MKKISILISIILSILLSSSISAQAPIKVVCIGNSITAGFGNTTQEKAWPGQLNILLGSRYTFLNCATSGTRMSKTVGPSFWNDGNFTTALSSNPQILIISLGTNDGDQNLWSQIKPTFKKDYIAMIDTFRTKGRNPIIYTCLPPPVFANAYQTANIKNELIPIIREISALKGTYIIDYFTPLLGNSSLFPDGVHPNDAGSLVQANVAYNVVKNSQLIVPYVSINGADSVETTSATVNAGNELTFKPLPKDGTWSWTGPNGFTATSRLVTLSNIQLNKGGVYTAVYTNAAGFRSVQNFMVTIAGCTAAAIIPYINAGSWASTTSATVNPGGTISFGPQPNDGTWCWTGPNGFFSNSREFSINNILKSQAGVYTASYYNATGCKTTKDFNITVDGAVVCPPLISYISVNGTWKVAGVINASLKSGGSIKFGPWPSDGTWNWTGPNGFSSNSRETSVNNIQTNQAGQYIGTFTTVAGCIETLTLTITVDGISAVETPHDDGNSGIKSYPNPATDIITLTSVPANTSITVFNLCGQTLLSRKSSGDKGNIDMNVRDIKAGSYLIKIGNSGEIKTLKLLKQ